MKLFAVRCIRLAVLVLIFLPGISTTYAQQDIEATIRQLEAKEHQAVLKLDTLALAKLWARDLIVNAPDNRVVLSGKSVTDRPVVSKLSYSSFTREVEQILIKGDIVISMGNEVVVHIGNGGDGGNAGKTVKRRYTNIWMKENGTWKLSARHASIICMK